MPKRTVFYSWQSDLPAATNRSFIEACLNRAIKDLRTAPARLDPCLDRDTANVPGSPDISATIQDKIDNCHAFVCDVSIIHAGGRPTPNPNVIFELGYAVKHIGWDRVICIANTHFGPVESLPFDIRQRRVRTYDLAPSVSDRADQAAVLTGALRRELELILTSPQDQGELLQLQFGDLDRKTPLGNRLDHSAVLYTYDVAAIEDYNPQEPSGRFGAAYHPAPNRDYNR